MNSVATRLMALCDQALQDGELDKARKIAKGISALTDQPAWEKSYNFIIEGRDPAEEIVIEDVKIANGMVDYLNSLHAVNGERLKHQSVRGGTQVDLTANQYVLDWLTSILGPTQFLGVWTTKIEQGGFHVNHIHPRGDVSNVIYLEVPENKSGRLEFGETRLGARGVQKSIGPEVGEMISFPCWLWHGVTKYEGAKPRLTVAFDHA